MAPEVIRGDVPYGTPVDVFSFGVTLWCLLAGDVYPYSSVYLEPEQVAKRVARNELRPRHLSRLDNEPDLGLLMKLCWAHQPNERPTMTNVLHALVAIREDMNAKGSEAKDIQGQSITAWLFGES